MTQAAEMRCNPNMLIFDTFSMPWFIFYIFCIFKTTMDSSNFSELNHCAQTPAQDKSSIENQVHLI